jgi:CheY-like chemotaxis protein
VSNDGRRDGRPVLRFEIIDTGVGVPPSVQVSLFQPFVQADSSTTRRFGGTGLGLAICRKLVELMGGDIGVTSTEGKGSSFWFNVRMEESPSSGLFIEPAPAAAPGEETLPNPHALRVLVAEDSKVNQMVATLQLRKLGCEVEVAGNGKEALAAWERRPYDLILMDCQMPEMDGFEATRRIRALESERSLPPIRIVAMTASALQGDREHCLEAGMDDYISKPAKFDEIRTLLHRHTPAAPGRTTRKCADTGAMLALAEAA